MGPGNEARYSHVQLSMLKQDVTVLHPHFPLEFIVTFTSYYTSEARDGFVSAALQPFSSWAIVPRPNPGQHYPSDFSLVRLWGTGQSGALEALRQHRLVRRVTPQRKLTRMLTFAGDSKLGSLSLEWLLCA